MPFTYKYPRPSVTADCVVFGYDGDSYKILLVRRANDPFKGYWAFPGGFLDMDETAGECAVRELEEETGIRVAAPSQFHTFTAVDRDPRGRVITVAYCAVTRVTVPRGGDDAAEARWFSTDSMPALAFDHAQLLRGAAGHVWRRLALHEDGGGIVPEDFTGAETEALREFVAALM